ncbi:MAG: preprotein translocase subunit SecE [Candidatus Magnetoovum sp. WYHC-5]|nr:preprotein translocase subunit SecE [Candidatus Magnetoovum sp. WYHC-5]
MNKIKAFFREVKIETKKVVFPGKGELIDSTKIVILFVVVFAVFLGVVDFGLSKIVQNLVK